jgi:uncharacterized protein (TIGR02246 family)
MSEPTKASVAAAVRDVLGTHTQAQDAGRTEDVVALYAEDAVLEMPGEAPIEGREAIRKAFTGWEPQLPQLHLVSNTVVSTNGDGEARALSDVAFLLRTEAGWGVQIVGHYDDTLRLVDGAWLIQRRATTFQA